MNKQIKHTYGGMTKDISKSRFPNTSYFDAKNFRITATDNQSTYALTNEKGTVVQITFPDYIVNSNNILISNQTIPYTVKDIPLGTHRDHKLVGSINVKDGIVFFTTGTIDSIWLHKFDNENHIELLYARNLKFTQDNQITGISNYENEKIEKIYWVDGLNQLRHLNIRHSKANGDYENIIDIPTDNINMIGKIKLKQPIIKDITTGGNHTAGVIQYAYVLYRLNGSTSNISPLSKQVPLTNGTNGGGNINEIVNTTPIIRIENIDTNYTNIIVYAIKYTSYGVLPEVNIIYDQKIPDIRNVEIFDDGSILGSIPIEEFILKTQNVKIPQHITSKDNRLFLANYKEKIFKVNLDVRAYSFNHYNNSPISRVYSDVESLNNLSNTPVRLITPNNFPDNYEDTFDNINLDFDTYKYSLSFNMHNNQLLPTIGGTSKYLTYEVIQTSSYDSRDRYFKDEEVYRLGIEFYNGYGINTKPMWIADFKAPQGNMKGLYNKLKFTWKQSFYDWLNNQNFNEYDKPVGYKLLIAERGADDKTIITSGIVSTMMFNLGNSMTASDYNSNLTYLEERSKKTAKMPSFLIRNLRKSSDEWWSGTEMRPLKKVNHLASFENAPLIFGRDLNESSSGNIVVPGNLTVAEYLNMQYTKMLQLFSPDTVFNQNLNITNNLKLKVKGLLKNTENRVWSQELKVDGNSIIADGTGEGISIRFANNVSVTEGNQSSIHDYGIISHPGGSDPNVYSKNLWYRKYGNSPITFTSFPKINIYNNNNPFSISKVTSTNYGNIMSSSQSDRLSLILSKNTANYYKYDLNINFNTNQNIIYDYIVTIGNDTYSGTITNQTQSIRISKSNIPFNVSQFLLDIAIYIQPQDTSIITGSFNITGNLNNNGIISFSEDDSFNNTEDYVISNNSMSFNVINNNTITESNYQSVTGNNEYSIYGKAEYAQRGQSFNSYYKDSDFRYINNLYPFKSFSQRQTGNGSTWDDMGVYNRRIVSINSDAVGNITIVPTFNDEFIKLEDIYDKLITQGSKMDKCIPYVELVKSREEIYLGGIYGGNSYEDKLRTKYLSIGDYNDISTNTVIINSPGDTFVQNFKFLRICRSDDNIINQGTYHMEELVEFLVETSIDLENRSDLSTSSWDNKISYSFDDYHKYNRVYSQPDNLRVNINNEYYVKEVDSYETNITSSKLKTSGELIDNWLTLLPNESIDLDGKLGPITNLLFLNDEVYTLQDRAFSKLSINPRVQVQGNDGVSIELGSGTVLQDYQYISTDVGCKNKHGSIVTPYGVYFYDSNNKRINQFSGQLTPISETAGLHSFLYNKDLKDLDIDKPLKNKGLSLGYDHVNNDVYFTFLTDPETFTLRYTEKGNMFVNNNDYGANHYCGLSNYFFGNLSDNKINRFYKGKYNEYFGEHKPSKVTLLINPEADLSIVVNNIAFKSEAYLDGVDQPNTTLTHIRAYNEYQDSGLVPLTTNRRGNIKRLFREWNAQVPRDEGKRDRIRNPWTYLELTFDNPGDIEFILHDMIVSYTV